MAQGEVQLTSVDSKYCGAGEGKLEILSEIGAGTFSVVFKAQRVGDGMLVAVKKIKVKDIRDEKSKAGCMKEMALLQVNTSFVNAARFSISHVSGAACPHAPDRARCEIKGTQMTA
ncbi:hypothetical protein V5799_013564 [Amblyomma americanum]|uniref:Protein kinase domain-containing protein n=1 Tax=Amblyomma americanum TaxID=6943 RepID=A0AAQ4E5P4_AMBAM